MNRALLPLEVGDEHLDRAPRQPVMNLPDRLGEDVCAEVGKVVAVHRGDYRMAQAQLGDRRRHPGGLGDVVLRRPPVSDGAVGAVPRADVAEDNESRGANVPALAEVRAVRFLAHGMEVELAHQPLEPRVSLAAGGFHLQPRRLPLGKRRSAVAAHDLVEHLAHVAGSAVRGARRHAGNAADAGGNRLEANNLEGGADRVYPPNLATANALRSKPASSPMMSAARQSAASGETSTPLRE